MYSQGTKSSSNIIFFTNIFTKSVLKEDHDEVSVNCLPRKFILFSRLGKTDANFGDLHDAGRLDIVYECIVASLFLSHGLRRDVTFHAVLNGPPKPPLNLKINSAQLYDVRTDAETWRQILKRVISGKSHPGISLDRTSFEALLKFEAQNRSVYVLEEGGRNIAETVLSEDSVFVLGDHVGLPKKAEAFALRYGEKLSLGKQPYLAMTCITIINYLLDSRVKD